MEDTFDNRALFLIVWHGAPHGETQKLFPEWTKKLQSLKVNSAEETIWLLDFAKKALAMRAA